MKQLLEFILKEVAGSGKFSVEEDESEGRVTLKVLLDKDVMGLVIGKGGQTIRAIQNVVRVKGRLENKKVFINVFERKV